MHIHPDDPVVEVSDATMDWACLALWGPNARKTLEKVTSSDVSNQAIPYLTADWIVVNGVDVLAQRVSYVGELGWELYVRPDRAIMLWDLLFNAGQEFGLEVGGYKVLDCLRLEKGYRYFTADVTPLENPYAAGLGFCVDLEKGDFVGRNALLKLKAEGAHHKLCTLVLDGEEYLPVYGGEAVYMDGNVVSRVRSGGYGFTLKRNIVLAYLPPELAKPGTRLKIDVFDAVHPAEVSKSVLLDPKGERLRS
jgi:4-methylaminobutanoate oxidase (formaldehyde-forming)